MFKRILVIAAALLALASPSHAQFLDEFNGDALAPHWTVFPSPPALVHTVGGGILTVTDLPLPSIPDINENDARIRTTFPPVAGNFVATAILGWAPGDERGFSWSLVNTFGMLIAQMSYGDSGVIGVLGVGAFPAPAPGLHEFKVTRENDTFRAFLDGSFLGSYADLSGLPVSATGVLFGVNYPNNGMEPLYADSISIQAPSPCTGLALLVGLSLCSKRRR